MTIKKRYFVWKAVKENDRLYSHPNTFLDKVDKWKDKIKVQEYPYNQNGWYLGHIEWDDIVSTTVKLAEHTTDFLKYEFDFKTPEEVIVILNKMYPSEKESYFSLDKDGFSLIDNRPVDDSMY